MNPLVKLYILAGMKKILRPISNVPFIGRLYLTLSGVLRNYGEVVIKIKDLWNYKMFLNVTDVGLSHMLLLNGCYEKTETEMLKKMIKPGDVFVDVGSNFGYYTLLASKLVGKSGKVFSFEPDPYNFSLMQRNIKINKCSNVLCVNKAVGEKDEKISFYIDVENLGRHNLIPNWSKHILTVDQISLDNFLPKGSRVNIVKIDIEGGEELAIKGIKKIIQKKPSIKLLIEFFPERIRQNNLNPANLKRLISSLGFSIYEISSLGLTKINFSKLLARTGGKGELMNILLQR